MLTKTYGCSRVMKSEIGSSTLCLSFCVHNKVPATVGMFLSKCITIPFLLLSSSPYENIFLIFSRRSIIIYKHRFSKFYYYNFTSTVSSSSSSISSKLVYFGSSSGLINGRSSRTAPTSIN
jgi:hypothetical protein